MTYFLVIHDKNNKYLSTSVLIKVKPESSISSILLTMVSCQSPTNLYLDESAYVNTIHAWNIHTDQKPRTKIYQHQHKHESSIKTKFIIPESTYVNPNQVINMPSKNIKYSRTHIIVSI
jgi:hypothetical protein